MAMIRVRRMVAIEFGMWRSVRSGGAAGSVTGGNGKFFEQLGGELRPVVQRVGTLAGFDFNERVDDLVPFGGCE
jgi:hypothetical protein